MHGVCGRMDDLGLLVLQGTHTARCASPLSAFILALFHRGIKHPEGVFIIFLQIVCRHPSYFCRSAAAVHRTAYHTRTVMLCRTNERTALPSRTVLPANLWAKDAKQPKKPRCQQFELYNRASKLYNRVGVSRCSLRFWPACTAPDPECVF